MRTVFGGTDNVLFIDLGAGYTVYSVCRVYLELNTYDRYTFINIFITCIIYKYILILKKPQMPFVPVMFICLCILYGCLVTMAELSSDRDCMTVKPT